MTFINEKSLLSCFSKTFIIHLEYPKMGSVHKKSQSVPQNMNIFFILI